MTQDLQEAFRQAAELPEKEQDSFAALLIAELQSEERWMRAFARSQDGLARMAAEARSEHRRGQTRSLELEDR